MLITTGFDLLKEDRLFLFILLYLSYMLISSLWSEPFNIKEFLYYIRLTLYVLMFIMLTVVLQKKCPDKFTFLLQAVCAGAALAAVLSIFLWYRENSFPDSRLVGMGTLVNPNPSAQIYGFFCVFAVNWALHTEKFIEHIWYFFIATVLFCFVLLTQSRGAIIAVIFGVVILFLLKLTKFKNFSYWLIVLLLIAGILFQEVLPYLVSRDVKVRIEIWKGFMHYVSEAPLFGYGYLNDLRVYVSEAGINFNDAHNVWVSTLRDGGVVGLGLLLVMLASAYWRVLQIDSKEERYFYFVLLIYAIPSMLLGTNRLIVRPDETWLILWFVLALILTHHLPASSSAAEQG